MYRSFAGLLLLLGAVAGSTAAQVPSDWPKHPIHFVTPSPPGGPVDLIARLIGEGLAKRLGHPVLVESKPGADGILAAEAFLTAKDTDDTFMVTFGGLLINNPVTHDKLPYDPQRDFVPIAMLALDTIVICARPDLPTNDLKQLLALAREEPERVQWASAPGEPRLRFAGWLKESRARMLFVPYKATSQAVTDLVAGRIDVMAAPLALAMPHITSRRLKALAVMAPARSAALLDSPAVSESGFQSLAMIPFIGLFGRKGISHDIVHRLNDVTNEVLSEPDLQKRLAAAGLAPTRTSPEELARVVTEKLRENRQLADLVGPLD